MIKLSKIYRSSYVGEDIIVERSYTGGAWTDTAETVPNAVTNNQISNQAVVLGNGPGRERMNLSAIKRHRGGLLGARALQSYGCNALYRDFTPDFLVATSSSILKEIADSGYATDNIVYTDAMHTLEYPGKFYLTPHNLYADAGTTAAYLAAFDGHKKVYLVGFEGNSMSTFNDNVYAGTNGYEPSHTPIDGSKWNAARAELFKTYDDTEFIQVTEQGGITNPEIWTSCVNFKQISFREFILEVDL
jgi:hypothetical protein